MFEKLKAYYRRWMKWARRNVNNPIYKVLVLFKVIRSATFEMMPQIEEFENDWDGWTIKAFKDEK